MRNKFILYNISDDNIIYDLCRVHMDLKSRIVFFFELKNQKSNILCDDFKFIIRWP